MKKLILKSIITLILGIFLISLVSADTQISDSLCGDMSDAGCNSGYIPACFRDNQGDIYYTCIWDDSQDCSDDPSRSLDCSRFCNDNLIYDYDADICCPITAPYYAGNNECRTNPQLPNPIHDGEKWIVDWDNMIADNYYIRHSTCFIFIFGAIANPSSFVKQETCEGLNNLVCEQTSTTFINQWENKGKVKGKCGVSENYCESNFDCPINIITEKYCEEDNLMEKTISSDCIVNECKMDEDNPEIKVLEVCDFGCGDVEGIFQCLEEVEPVCGNGIIEINGGEECDDGNLIEEDGCDSNCKIEEPFDYKKLISYIAGGIVVTFIIIIVFIGIKKKSK